MPRAAEASPAFERGLGTWSAGALVAGTMIGTGIFFFVAPVAERLSSPAAILAAWIVGAAVASCGALCVAELASAYPRAGGIYAFLVEAYGPFTGFLYTWAGLAVTRVGSLAIFALAFSTFAAELVDGVSVAAGAGSKPLAVAAIVVITAVNAGGVRVGGAVQNVLTAIKVGALVAVLAVGVLYAQGLLVAHEVEIAVVNTGGAWAPMPFLAALVPVLWTLGGWEEPAFVAEEVRHPERALPVAILGGLWLVAILYVFANAAYLAILSPAEMAGSGNATATLAMQRALGPGATRLLAATLIVSTLGAANGMVMTGARIAYATGRDQPSLRWLAVTHPTTRVPVRALVVQAVLVCAAIVWMEDPFVLLLWTGLAYWAFAALVAGATIVLRRRGDAPPGSYRLSAYPWVPMVFIVASVAMAASVVVQAPSHALGSLAIVALGAAVFAAQRLAAGGRRGGDSPTDPIH